MTLDAQAAESSRLLPACFLDLMVQVPVLPLIRSPSMMRPEPKTSENSAYTTLLSCFVKTWPHRSAWVAHAPVSSIARASATERTLEPSMMTAPTNRNTLDIACSPKFKGAANTIINIWFASAQRPRPDGPRRNASAFTEWEPQSAATLYARWRCSSAWSKAGLFEVGLGACSMNGMQVAVGL